MEGLMDKVNHLPRWSAHPSGIALAGTEYEPWCKPAGTRLVRTGREHKLPRCRACLEAAESDTYAKQLQNYARGVRR